MDLHIPIRAAHNNKNPLLLLCLLRLTEPETCNASISLELVQEWLQSVFLVHTGWTEVQDIQVKVCLNPPFLPHNLCWLV